MTTTIRVPSRLNLRNSIQFSNRLAKLAPAEHWSFDFTQLSWVEPFGLLLTACAIREYMHSYAGQCKFDMVHKEDGDAFGYAAFMGFFDSFDFPVGNAHGGDPGRTYLPVTFRNVSELLQDATHDGERIEDISRDLARQFLRVSSGEMFAAVAYSFREMIRNVVEHSESKRIGYCAQYWPKNDIVEIAIVDTGIGLRTSLSENPQLKATSDRDAILMALAPGVSGKMYNGAHIKEDDIWQNSGFGLYMNYRLSNEGGDFFICSGKAGLYRRKNESDNKYFDTDFPGTIVRLRLSKRQLLDWRVLLDRFKKEGNHVIRRSTVGAALTASTMSTLIRDDFENVMSDIRVGSRVKHMRYGVGCVEALLIIHQKDHARVRFHDGRVKPVPVVSLILTYEE